VKRRKSKDGGGEKKEWPRLVWSLATEVRKKAVTSHPTLSSAQTMAVLGGIGDREGSRESESEAGKALRKGSPRSWYKNLPREINYPPSAPWEHSPICGARERKETGHAFLPKREGGGKTEGGSEGKKG